MTAPWGITFVEADVTSQLTNFFSIGAVVFILGVAIALRLGPQIARALKSLAGRR